MRPKHPLSTPRTWLGNRLAAQSDDVTGFDVKGSTIYLLTHKDAPTFKLVATSLDAPNVAGARAVIAPGMPMLEDLGVASDGLYVLGRNGGFGQITKVALGADGTPGAGTPLALPFDGAVNAIATDPREPGVTFGMYRLDARCYTITPTPTEPSPTRTSNRLQTST